MKIAIRNILKAAIAAALIALQSAAFGSLVVVVPAEASGSAAVFFLSANSMPNGANGENVYLTVWGYNLAAVTDVKVNGKSQTILNTSYADTHLTLHPALVKMGHDTGVFDTTYNDSVREPYERMDVTLDSVVSGDTGIQFVGAGLVTTELGTVDLSDTISSFAIHTGNSYFVDTDAGAGSGTEASPWNLIATAESTSGAGDAVYIMETTSPMGDTFTLSGSGDNGTASQPKLWAHYPNQNPEFSISGSFIFYNFNPAEYVTFAGFSVTGSGTDSMVTGMGGAKNKSNLRWVGLYGTGFYAAQSGAFAEISGYGSSYATGANDVRMIGIYMHDTQATNQSSSNPHVYYFGGRGYSDNFRVLHCRSTEHGQGRVQQIYGHTTGEKGRNFMIAFNNLEGRKGAGNKPTANYLTSGSDGNDKYWVEDVIYRYNTTSGGVNGIDITAGPVHANAVVVVTIDNIVGYENTSNDIQVTRYGSATIDDSCLEGAVSDPEGDATQTNISTNYPECL